MDVKLNLSWDTYQKNICNGLGMLQQRGEFVDMTIAADGHQVKVHQMVLSLVSPYIKELITSAQCQHPIIFLNQVSYQTLQLILEYAYTGEVQVGRDNLTQFLEAGRALHFKGLEIENMKSNSDGDLLRFFGQTHEDKPVYKTLNINSEEPKQTATKRKMTDMPETDTSHDDEHNYEDEMYVNPSCGRILTHESSHIDDHHLDANDDCDTVLPEQKSLTQAKLNPNTSSGPSMQYTLSCQGSVQLVLNRYLYRFRHTRKNEERMWRCTEYDKQTCRAYVVTKNKMVVERGCSHNHPFHDKQILKKVRQGNMFTAYNMAQSLAVINAKKKKSIEKSIAEKKQDEKVDEWTIKPRS